MMKDSGWGGPHVPARLSTHTATANTILKDDKRAAAAPRGGVIVWSLWAGVGGESKCVVRSCLQQQVHGVVRVNCAAALGFSEAAEASHYTSMLFCEGQSSCVPVRHTHISTASPDSGTGVQQNPATPLGVLVWRSIAFLVFEICDATVQVLVLTKAYNAANSRVCIRKATSHQTDRRDEMADRMAGKKMRWRRGVKQYRSKICLLHTPGKTH
jgi:hypothetical protein